MKNKLALLLSISILFCSFNNSYCNIEGNFGRIVLASLVIGGALGLGVSLASKFKAPSSAVFASGYYGSLLSLGVISLKAAGGGGDGDYIPFVIFPVIVLLGFVGLLPTGLLALNDIGRKARSGNGNNN